MGVLIIMKYLIISLFMFSIAATYAVTAYTLPNAGQAQHSVGIIGLQPLGILNGRILLFDARQNAIVMVMDSDGKTRYTILQNPQ